MLSVLLKSSHLPTPLYRDIVMAARSYGSTPGGAQAQGGKIGGLRNQVDEVRVKERCIVYTAADVL